MFKTLKNCVSGLYALLQAPEGWLSLLSLMCVSYLAMKGHVGDVAFASVMTLIPSIMIWTEHKKALNNTTQQSDVSVSDLPPKGQI